MQPVKWPYLRASKMVQCNLSNAELRRNEDVGEHAGDDTWNPPPLGVAKCPSLLHTLECRALLDLTAPLHLLMCGCTKHHSGTADVRPPPSAEIEGARLPLDTSHVPVEGLSVVARVTLLTRPSFRGSRVAGYLTSSLLFFEGAKVGLVGIAQASPPKHVGCDVSFEPRYGAKRTEPARVVAPI